MSETQFQRFFHLDGVLPLVILHKKKSGYMRWYLFFFCDIWTFFCQIKLRLIIVKKKVQISKKKSRYHFFFLTSAPYFGIKRGYQFLRYQFFHYVSVYFISFEIKVSGWTFFNSYQLFFYQVLSRFLKFYQFVNISFSKNVFVFF